MLVGMYDLHCDDNYVTIPVPFRHFIQERCSARGIFLLIDHIEFGGISATPVGTLPFRLDTQVEVIQIEKWRLPLPPSIRHLQESEDTRKVVLIGCMDRFEMFTPHGWEEAARHAERELSV